MSDSPDPLELDRLRSRIAELERQGVEGRAAEQRRQASEERYRLLIERMNEGFVATDRDNRIDIVNPRLAEMLGYSRSEMKGRYLGNFVKDRQRLEVQEDRRHHGLAEPYELTWITKDERPVETVVSPTSILDAEGRFIGSFAVVTDVTERNRLEQERRSLEARMRTTQKMESLGLLAGGVAHDFNNLLVGILGHAGLALMELPEDSPARSLMQRVEVAAVRASELTQEMLAYSGRGNFQVETVDLSLLVEEMIQLLNVTISKKAVLDVDFATGLPGIRADATQVRQVVMNLITNASEALQGGVGAIRIATGLVDADRGVLSETYVDDNLPAGTYVYLEVTDTGSGMDRETRSKIFDPFFTTKFTGRGLGLAAVLGIVRGHRGAIRVDSQVGRGTSIRVFFPAADAAPKRVEPATAESRADHGSGCILIADDEELVRSVARLSLESAGYKVLLATDGIEAVEVFRQHHDELRAVLLDITMPRLGGDEAFLEIMRIRSDAKVIVASGCHRQAAVERFEGVQPAAFLQKPFRPRQLIDSVRRVLDEE